MSILLFIDDDISELDERMIKNANHIINFSSFDIENNNEIIDYKGYLKIRHRLKKKYTCKEKKKRQN